MGLARPSATGGSYVHYPIFEGWKRYEIANHLGNVLAVITDRKRGNAVSGTAIQWFEADVVAAQQYYPFGMLMPGNASAALRRQYTLNSADYRYGFNGKEGDDEIKGDDNQQDYGMRIYDPRVARFLSVDPIAKEYPELTTYQFASNSPISGIDLDGLEYYYAADGRFLGSSGKSTKIMVVTANDEKSIGVIEGNLACKSCQHAWINNYSNELPGITNDELNKLAGIAYREEHASIQGTFSVASAIINFVNGYNAHIDKKISLSDIVNDKLPNYTYASKQALVPNDPGHIVAFSAAINAIQGGIDYSNGATHWDGFDFAGKGPGHIKATDQGFEISQDHVDGLKKFWTDGKLSRISSGEFTTFSKDLKGGKYLSNEKRIWNKTIDKPKMEVHRLLLYKSSAQYGGTVFWKPNKDAEENKAYEWKYFYSPK